MRIREARLEERANGKVHRANYWAKYGKERIYLNYKNMYVEIKEDGWYLDGRYKLEPQQNESTIETVIEPHIMGDDVLVVEIEEEAKPKVEKKEEVKEIEQIDEKNWKVGNTTIRKNRSGKYVLVNVSLDRGVFANTFEEAVEIAKEWKELGVK